MGKKRRLFDEMMEGVESMRDQRKGKTTLRNYTVEELPPLEIDSALIRGVFARHLRVSRRTLENWEQGRAKPNAQAAALILMVQKYPDTIQRLQSLDNQ